MLSASGDQPRKGESPEEQGKRPILWIQDGSFLSRILHRVSCPAPAAHQGLSSISPHHLMLPPTPKTFSSALVMLPVLPNPFKTIKICLGKFWKCLGSGWANKLIFLWLHLVPAGQFSPRLGNNHLLGYPPPQISHPWISSPVFGSPHSSGIPDIQYPWIFLSFE